MSPPISRSEIACIVLRFIRHYGFEFTEQLADNHEVSSRLGERKIRVEFDSVTMRISGFATPADDPMVLADLVVLAADLARVATGEPLAVTLFPLPPASADEDVDESELEQFDEVRRHLDDVHQDHEVDLSELSAGRSRSHAGIARAEIVTRGANDVNVEIRIAPDATNAALSIQAQITGVEEPGEPDHVGVGTRPWIAWLPTDGKGRRVGFQLARRFREDGVECRIAAGEGDPDALLAWADRGGARWSVMLGGNELLRRSIEVVDWGTNRGRLGHFDSGRDWSMDASHIKAVFKDLFEGTPMTTGDVD